MAYTDPRVNSGLEKYLPEDFYFLESTDIDVWKAIRVTAKYIARWADTYSAGFLHMPSSYQSGKLPHRTGQRNRLIDGVIDLLKQEPTPSLSLICFSLYKRDQPLLDQHDEIPGPIFLSPKEFSGLQDEWGKQGLPRDFYYPAQEQRTVVEPTFRFGGVVQINKHYSPKSWIARNESPSPPLPIPSEEERLARFSEACLQFTEAILLRIMELKEPGKEVDRKEIARLARLIRAVNQLGSSSD